MLRPRVLATARSRRHSCVHALLTRVTSRTLVSLVQNQVSIPRQCLVSVPRNITFPKAVSTVVQSRCQRRYYSKKEKKKKDDSSSPLSPPASGQGLETVLSQLASTFGTGTVTLLENPTSNQQLEVSSISTGSLTLDLALSIGGLPRRRIVEIYGPESSGKTTLALSVVAQAQKEGGRAAYIDVEHALDPKWAKKLGVKTEELLFAQPDSGEEALEIADTLSCSGKVDVIVVDSVAALVPKSELEGEMGETQVGVQARLMSHALRKLTSGVSKNNTLIIFINQIRMKIGVLFGNPETTSGGNALKFYSSVRLEVRRGAQIKIGEEVIGTQLRVKVVKNKVGPPFRTAEFDLLFDSGISKSGEILDLAVKENLITKSGAWYTTPATQVNKEGIKEGEESIVKLGQGREKAKLYLEEHKDLMNQLEVELRKRLMGSAVGKTGESAVVGSEGDTESNTEQ